MHQIALTAGLVASALMAVSKTIIFQNDCDHALWPAVNPPIEGGLLGGWEMDAHSIVSHNVPDNWSGARIWARASCTYAANGTFTCLDGDCGHVVNCMHTSTNTTLAEFNLSPSVQDTYSESIADGYNVAFNIENDKGCPVPGCANDTILAICPEDRRVVDENNNVILCLQCPHPPGDCDTTLFNQSCPHANTGFDIGAPGSAACEDDATYTIHFCPPQIG